MQLALVRDERLAPPAAGALAVPGLEADREVAVGEVLAQPRPALPAARTRRIEAADLAAEGGLQDGPPPSLHVADDLVAGHERVARQRVQIERRVAGDRRQVRPADAGQAGEDAPPPGSWQLG